MTKRVALLTLAAAFAACSTAFAADHVVAGKTSVVKAGKLGKFIAKGANPFTLPVAGGAEDPTINDHLGDAYWKVGRKREATFQWAHARDLEPDKELLPVILSKLQHGLQDSPAPLTMSPAPAASPATAPTAGAQNAPATPGAQTSVPPVAAQPTSMAARAAGGAIVPGAMLSLPAAAASN